MRSANLMVNIYGDNISPLEREGNLPEARTVKKQVVVKPTAIAMLL